jgi:stress response protein SCP2
MGLNRTAWTRYFKHTHFFGQRNFANRFTPLYVAAYISLGSKYDNLTNKALIKRVDKLINEDVVEVTQGGNLVYRTFASRMQTAIDNKNWKAIKKLADGKENYIMRNLSTVSNGIKDKDEADFIKYLKKAVKDTDIGVLFSLLSINVDSEYRVMDVKGDTRIETAQYPEFFRKIQKEIRSYVKSQYGFSGQVKYSPELEDRIVPFLSKNSELERGTKIAINDDINLFFYVHWMERAVKKDGHYDEWTNRTDLDLSFIAFDENWRSTSIAFYRQANGYITLSGDFTSAPPPNGATEYGKIRIDQLPKNVRYIVPVINCFTANGFDNNEYVRAGFFTSQNVQFTLKQDAIKYNITAPAQMNLPFVLDVQNREVIVIDYNRRERMGYIAESYLDDVRKVILATKTKNYISIGKLAEMLSGTGKTTSLTIANNAGKGEINPESLFSLFTKKKEKTQESVKKNPMMKSMINSLSFLAKQIPNSGLKIKRHC